MALESGVNKRNNVQTQGESKQVYLNKIWWVNNALNSFTSMIRDFKYAKI